MLDLKIDLIFEYVKCSNRNCLPLDITKIFHHFSAAVLLQSLLFQHKLLIVFLKIAFKFFTIELLLFIKISDDGDSTAYLDFHAALICLHLL